MAVSYGFYGALYTNNRYDRVYHDGEMSKLFDGLIIDGIYLSSRKDDPVNQQFMVTAESNNMTVKVAPGRAWFIGTYTISDSDVILAVESSNINYSRIDAVVIEVNTQISKYDDPSTPTERYNSLKIVKGIPSAIPNKPIMVHEDGINQFPIAYITVSKGTTAIRPYDIEYVVGTETPYFAWLGERLTIAELYSKWEPTLGIVTQPFITWFNSMQRMLNNGGGYEEIVNEVNNINLNNYIKGTYPKVDEQVAVFSGDGDTVEFSITSENIKNIADVFVDGKMVHNYEYDSDTKTITLKSAPAIGVNNVEIYYVADAISYTIYF